MTALDLATAARTAGRRLARASTEAKNAALLAMAAAVRATAPAVLAANALDVSEAKAAGVAPALLDRLVLDAKRVEAMAASLESVARLPDPVGEVDEVTTPPGGFRVERVRIPLGTILMIYEARPNATVEAAGLCVKSGNAVILRGGKEALRSNLVLAAALRSGLEQAQLPTAAVQVVETPNRELLGELLKLDGQIDLCIPRGGQGLIQFVSENARMPVVKHAEGVCHVFVHAAADLAMAERVVVNSKAARPGVCNSAECLLVDGSIAEAALPRIGAALVAAGVELRACERSLPVLQRSNVAAIAAKPEDFGHEFLALVMAVKVVDGLEAAIGHIERFSTGHTDSILTNDLAAARRFTREVDSAAVVVNATTRLNDGGTLGLGAEIGISTSRLHAYGPMALRELTTRKWVVIGDGHIR